jgi:hypothetical protein
MKRKLEMIESLLSAYDQMIKEVSEEELAKSGLFAAWLKQVSSALIITNMEIERQVWDEVTATKVSLHERKALEAYGTGMRAIILGILYTVEQELANES